MKMVWQALTLALSVLSSFSFIFMHWPKFHPLLFFGMFLTSTVVSSQSQATVNRSIDDGFGDSLTGQKPVFLPMDGWDSWKNETCTPSICFLIPPASSAFDQTYTQTTVHSGGFGPISITFDFTGVAIYIYFILANNVTASTPSGTSANFTLDGSLAGNFSHEPDLNAPEFQYNVLAFSTTGLENITHEMIISSAAGNDPSAESFLLIFDYALYTFLNALPEPESSTSPTVPNATTSTEPNATSAAITSTAHSTSPPVGRIVGGAVGGGLGAVGVVIALITFLRHRRKPRIIHSNTSPSSGGSTHRGPGDDHHTSENLRVYPTILARPEPGVVPPVGKRRRREIQGTTQEMSVQIDQLPRVEGAERSADETTYPYLGSTSESGSPEQQRAMRLDVAQSMGQIRRILEDIALLGSTSAHSLSEAPPGYAE